MFRIGLIILSIILTGFNNSYAKDIFGGKSDIELFEESRNSNMGHDPLMVKYVYTELYVGMPENEFVKLYEENKSLREGEFKPCIIKNKKNYYYLQFHDGKGRVTFKDGKLIKFEELVHGDPPFVFLVYSNRTYLLLNREFFNRLFLWMPKEEFLTNFKDKITEKFNENYYSVKAPDGTIWGVSFLNGFLDDAWIQ